MLEIGSFRSRTCSAITRRAFVRAAASVPLALGLSTPQAWAAAAETPRKAKSVLLVWLTGGPSHIDTFDPKPNAPDHVAGPFAPIATRTSGVRFTEILPRLAARSHRFAVIRSSRVMGGHDLTGLSADPDGYSASKSTDVRGGPPNFGSIVARHRGATQLPPFVSVFPAGKIAPGGQVINSRGQGGGSFFGAAYDPMLVFCGGDGRAGVPSLKLLPGVSPERLTDRQLLRDKLEETHRAVDTAPAASWDRQLQMAHRLLTDLRSQQAFHLDQEPEAVRDAYGHTSFGQSLLLGRRLVEAGVPYVQVNFSSGGIDVEESAGQGWDTHYFNFEILYNHLGPVFDRAFSALLDDLVQLGLLENTLVAAFGEFGRSPHIEGGINGRNHWPRTGFSLWSGAGVQGGRIVGETDRMGGEPVTDPITAQMIGTTIVELAGVDAQVRGDLKVLQQGRLIHELF